MTIKAAWFRMLSSLASRQNASTHYLAQSARYFVEHHDYEQGSFTVNGEELLIRRLTAASVLFDVGANRGDWSASARRYHPEAVIHAFEVVPATYEKLSHSVGNAVTTHNFGLGASAGVVPIHCLTGDDEIASIHAITSVPTTIIEGVIETGDAFCKANGIAHIDLLKIDVEGGERDVLKGFARMLEAGQVDVIQFEYGLLNIAARFLLADAYDLLGAGYEIGLLRRDGVHFRPYLATHETFRGPNYVAVRRALPETIKRLRAPVR